MKRGDPRTNPTRPRPLASGRQALQKFVHLRGDDRLLVGEAVVLLGAIRVTLVVVPFVRVRKALGQLAGRGRRRDGSDPSRTAWAVSVASRYVPGGRHCLTQALAGQLMLARSGIPSELRLGLGRGERGELHGHAWLESGGRIVIGGGEAGNYKPIDSFDGGLP